MSTVSEVLEVHRIKCGTCGYWCSALTRERVVVHAYEHLLAAHGVGAAEMK